MEDSLFLNQNASSTKPADKCCVFGAKWIPPTLPLSPIPAFNDGAMFDSQSMRRWMGENTKWATKWWNVVVMGAAFSFPPFCFSSVATKFLSKHTEPRHNEAKMHCTGERGKEGAGGGVGKGVAVKNHTPTTSRPRPLKGWAVKRSALNAEDDEGYRKASR